MAFYMYAFNPYIRINENWKIESAQTWQNPWVKLKELNKRPFTLILDWILVEATWIMQINLFLWNRKEGKRDHRKENDIPEKMKSQFTLPIALRKSKEITPMGFVKCISKINRMMYYVKSV